MDPFDTQRKRAWLLFEAENLKEANRIAKGIYDTYGTSGDEYYVVVRADVVESDGYKILVPVDARGESELEKIVDEIKQIAGKAPVMFARVQNHYPPITYLAHGFVSEEEFNKASKKQVHPDLFGRIQRKSPGDNPWG
jgi:hypothetical protein